MESKMTRSASPERYILVSFSARRAGSEGIRLRVTAGELIARSRKGRGRATQKWRGVKNSKKAARSLRTRTAGRSVSHAGRGETRFPAADGLGRHGFVHFVRSGKLPSALPESPLLYRAPV